MDYYWGFRFEWDEQKSQRCFLERGFDFAYASHAFVDPYQLVKIDRRLFVVVFAERIASIRIISARKANQRETRFYEQQHRPL